ncbi:MAG: hypothetical protein A7316_04390, partial [Candidatus Altiarchaeales archaeon WOR_SM1_86-2]
MNLPQKVIMFGGKGGVGKTTTSAASALHFSSLGEKTLILSTDPVLSLSDMFEKKIGDKETLIAENLYAVELSSDEVLRRWKEKFGDEVYEVLSSFAQVDYDIIDYIGGAPGIDEEFMLDYILELADKGEYDRIVWDTAPAGHTMRLLNMPVQFIEHLDAAARVYMSMKDSMDKLQRAAGIKRSRRSIFDIIDSWKELAEEIAGFLRDGEKVGFAGVTIPEALGIYQIERIISDFDAYGLKTGHIIINGVIQEADCEFHRARMQMQKGYIERIRQNYGSIAQIIEIPLFHYEI